MTDTSRRVSYYTLIAHDYPGSFIAFAMDPADPPTRHRRPHPLLHPSHIEVVQRTRTCAGRDGGTFEKILHILIVVVIQTAHGDALTVALQFASDVAVLAAVMCLDCETAVGPELPLGAETVGCLQQCHQQGGANQTDRRNLTK